MIVRELITLLGFSLDKASYDKASKAYDSLQGKITQEAKATQQAAASMAKLGQGAQQAAKGTGMLGQALGMFQRFSAQAGISNLLKEYTTLASDANETRGALTQLFGPENIAQVERWAEVQGAAMGRSQYDLQAYAARLGSVLGPVTKSREEAQRMAQSLSELSVDLASFFNTRDEDAMVALRAGLTGEYESLKRYGIVVNEATLQEVAHQQGISKKITEMTTAEKTELRYMAIMARSTAAQGDAVRTSDGFANSTKALKAQLKTLGIDAAKKLIPVVEKVVRWARDGATAFAELAKKGNLLESAMWTLAAVAAVLAVEFYGAFILPTLGVLALIVVVDQLLTTIRGGKTALTEFFNEFAGAGAAEEYVLNLAAGWSILSEEMSKAWVQFSNEWGNAGVLTVLADTWVLFFENLGILATQWADETADALLWPFRKFQEWLQSMGIKTGADIQQRGYATTAGRGTGAREETLREQLARRYRDRIRASAGGGAAAGDSRAGLVAGLRGRQYAAARGIAASAGLTVAQATSAAPGSVAAPGAGAGAAGPGGAVIVPVNSAAPTININGGDEARIARVVMQVLAARAKSDMAAVGGRGRS